MQKITVDQWKHIPAGTKIWNGYANGYCTAPSAPGHYTLFEFVSERNTHVGWTWELETDDVKSAR